MVQRAQLTHGDGVEGGGHWVPPHLWVVSCDNGVILNSVPPSH